MDDTVLKAQESLPSAPLGRNEGACSGNDVIERPLSLSYPQLQRASRKVRGSFEFAADACTRNLCFSACLAVPYNVYRA